MSATAANTVLEAPARPVLIFDGNCHFCRRWIERWREVTGDVIAYEPFQEAAERFPEIPRQAFERAVHFIETDGTVHRGAAAVFRSLGQKPGGSWLLWGYQHVPGFAAITETAYGLVARNREIASFCTRRLWGKDVRRPDYSQARQWFLQALGAIYLIAFVSLWVQVLGLVGEKGISPVGGLLWNARAQLGQAASWLLPTLCWLNSSDLSLHLLCGLGSVFSILLLAGLLPRLSLIFLYVFYLSLTVAGQTFLSFQWDILLLEAGFLAIFLAPFCWRIRAGDGKPVSRIGHFLLKLLLFKLILMSGVAKLTSGDISWLDFSALNYHYETQPLPTIIGWWAHQCPDWFKQLSTIFVLVLETLVALLIWAPRRLRHFACGLFVSLQILIALTGNYCFFNLLTVALCLLLLDHTVVGAGRGAISGARTATPLPGGFRRFGAFVTLLFFLPINAALIYPSFETAAQWPRTVGAAYSFIEPFRIANGYGLFRVMTKSRPEIVIEGSADGVEWAPYEFHWKPGDLRRPPQWAAPHQPRLDWQMWFAALGSYEQSPWFINFMERLLKNERSVTALLARNPFPGTPPRYIRATLYDYHFTTVNERRETGAWWKRGGPRSYFPAVSLENFGPERAP